jgi:hypothetical protein
MLCFWFSVQSRTFRAVHDTAMFVLQNEAGFERWPPTDEIMARVRNAFANEIST